MASSFLEAQQADLHLLRRRSPQRLRFHGPCESGRPVTAEAQRVPPVWNFGRKRGGFHVFFFNGGGVEHPT